uniref:HAT family dimerisation domain containing protein n=1 Tax=Oryza sativa subsp. japonica TaxID=39947 RepID=Q2QLX9_ORYSJ|nr:hAT family dimerisation domain containing protein [Oryza sativa Japonica Group]
MDPNFPYQSPSFTLGDFDPNYMSGFDGTSGSAPTPPSVEEVPVHTAVVEEVPVQAETASEGFSGTASGSVSTHTSSKRSRTSGHLKRHAESCAKKQGIQLRQQQLMVNPDGTVRSWEYDPMVARESLVRLIARQDLPLNFGESPAFEHYIQQSHNPRFKATGMKRVGDHIDAVRQAIAWLTASNPRIAAWKRFCNAAGVEAHPRCKLRGLSAILSLVGDTIGVDYSSFYTEVRRKLYEVFGRYEVKFQEVRQRRPPPIPTTGKKKIQWGRIWGGSSSSSIQGGGSSSATSGDASSHVVAEELSGYLDSDAIHHEAQDFNVLGWWNDHKITYPVLSKLARDVLTVPVSTVSSESAFSLCGRIIEDRRTTLRSDHVEMLLSVKDWELARQHAQYTADNQELAAHFEQLYLDPDQPQ